jgi:hypothetical protein
VKVHVATVGRDQANKVDVYVGKMVVWYQNNGWMGELEDMSVDIVPLAEQACH